MPETTPTLLAYPASPGYRTSEGMLSGLVVALAPLLPAILGAQLSWQHVVLFAVAGAVVAIFGIGRVVLKLRGLTVMLVLLLAAPAHADDPPLLPTRGPTLTVQVPPMTDAEKIAAALAAFNAGLQAAQQGVAAAPLLKPWTETRTGQIVMGCVAAAIIVTSAGGTTAGLIATWPR